MVNRKWQVVNGEAFSGQWPAARETGGMFYVLDQDATAFTMKNMKSLKVNPTALDTETERREAKTVNRKWQVVNGEKLSAVSDQRSAVSGA